LFCLVWFDAAYSQTTVTLTTSGSWTVPAGVTSLKVETWGGGGGGGLAYGNDLGTAGGGGGGGGYATSTLAVSPGQVYTYTIGAGGAGGTFSTLDGGTGGTTTFTGTGGIVNVSGGSGGYLGDNIGSGGSGGSGITYTTQFLGGQGGTGYVHGPNSYECVEGGSGGGGAGNAANGHDASTTTTCTNDLGGTGGAGSPNSAPYIGGNGHTFTSNNTTNRAGGAGSIPGGGGSGGACRTGSSNANGGAGARGQIVLTYTVVSCTTPSSYTVTGGGSYCSGGSGVSVGLSNSQSGVTYQLYNGSNPVGSTTSGTGSALNFGPITTAGTYTMQTTTAGGYCAVTMTGNAVVTISALPTITGTTPGSNCGAGTVTLGASASAGTVYWYDVSSGGTSIGSGISFVTPIISTTTTYYVDATNNGCTTGSRTGVTATINPVPAAPTSPQANPSAICNGQSSTLTATVGTGLTVDWFGSSCGTGAVTSPVSPAITSVYYGLSRDLTTGCVSTTCVTDTVNVSPALGTPVFSLGATSIRCIGAATVSYTATATNNTGISYSLDALSLAGGNTIDPATGQVTYDAAWTGTSVITVTAQGCGGPLTASHTVTIAPVVGTPIFLSGPVSYVCVGSPPTAFPATSTASSGITYNLDASSTAAGNTINSSTAEVTFDPTWTGTMIVTAIASGCGGPKVSKHTVNVLPNVTAPVFDLGASSTRCQGAGNITYTANATNDTAKVYSLDAASIAGGNTIDPATGEVTYDASWSGTTTITVVVEGCNGPLSATHTVTINPFATLTISGTASVCAGSTGNVYATNAGMTSYTWTVPSAGTISAGGTAADTSVTVTWNTAGVHVVSLIYSDGTCTSINPATESVTVNAAPSPTITGASSPCVNSTGNIYFTESGMSNYVWNVSLNGTITAGGTATDTSVTVTWNTAGAQSVSVNYTESGGCSAASPFTMPVTVQSVPAAAGTITGFSTVCQGTMSVVYTVGPIANATNYYWNVPTGATIVSGANTNSITVDYSSSAVSGSVSVQGNNSCGNGLYSPAYFITINTTPSTPVITIHGDTLSSSVAIGNQWYLDGNPISGANAQTYIATTTGHYLDVAILNGCNSDTSNHIYVVITGIQNYSSAGEIKVFPNPNDGSFSLSLQSQKGDDFTISVYNVVGEKVYELRNCYMDATTQKSIDMGIVPAGLYTLVVESNLGKFVKKMIVF